LRFKLIFVDPVYDPSGADRNDIKRHLLLARQNGIECKLLSQRLQANNRVVRLLFSLLFSFKLMFFCVCYRAISKRRALVYFTTLNPYTKYFDLLITKVCGFEIIAHVHRINKHTKRLAMPFVDYFFVTEKCIKDELILLTDRKIFCYNFYDNEFSEVEPNIVKLRGRCTVAFVGAIRKEKGISEFLDFVEKSHHKRLDFLLQGEMVDVDSLTDDRINDLVRNGVLKFKKGFIPADQYVQVLAGFDYIMLPYNSESYYCRGSAMIYELVDLGVSYLAPNIGVFKYYADKFSIGTTYDSLDGLAEKIMENKSSDFSAARRYLVDHSYKEKYQEFIAELHMD